VIDTIESLQEARFGSVRGPLRYSLKSSFHPCRTEIGYMPSAIAVSFAVTNAAH